MSHKIILMILPPTHTLKQDLMQPRLALRGYKVYKVSKIYKEFAVRVVD